MAKSLDKVLQPDGTYKWELVEPSYAEKMGNGAEASAVCEGSSAPAAGCRSVLVPAESLP